MFNIDLITKEKLIEMLSDITKDDFDNNKYTEKNMFFIQELINICKGTSKYKLAYKYSSSKLKQNNEYYDLVYIKETNKAIVMPVPVLHKALFKEDLQKETNNMQYKILSICRMLKSEFIKYNADLYGNTFYVFVNYDNHTTWYVKAHSEKEILKHTGDNIKCICKTISEEKAKKVNLKMFQKFSKYHEGIEV